MPIETLFGPVTKNRYLSPETTHEIMTEVSFFAQAGAFIRQERKEMSLSQMEFQKLTGVSYKTIQRIEKGEEISDKSLTMIFNKLGCLYSVERKFTKIKKS